MTNKIDKNHNEKRAVFRVIGPVILVIGIIFILIGAVNFFSAINNPFMKSPNLFWCFFVGMPLLFFGFITTAFGFMGAVARYQAEEIAPVGKDVFNYMADGTKEGVKTIAKSIHDGISENDNRNIACKKCNSINLYGSKYCNDCGSSLLSECNNCGFINDSNAKFCNDCGHKLNS